MNKIFTLIEQKSTEEIKAINAQKEKDVFGLQKQFAQLCDKERKQAKESAQKEVEKSLQEYEQTILQNNQFALLKSKQSLIEKVFAKAQQEILHLESKGFEKFIAKIAQNIPKNAEGVVLCGEKTAVALKKVWEGKVKNDLKEEGFIFEGKDFELDFRLSEVINNLKQEISTEINQILFV